MFIYFVLACSYCIVVSDMRISVRKVLRMPETEIPQVKFAKQQ